jgi:hypothetical protein
MELPSCEIARPSPKFPFDCCGVEAQYGKSKVPFVSHAPPLPRTKTYTDPWVRLLSGAATTRV